MSQPDELCTCGHDAVSHCDGEYCLDCQCEAFAPAPRVPAYAKTWQPREMGEVVPLPEGRAEKRRAR